MNKAALYDLYVSLQSTPKTTHRQGRAGQGRAQNSPAQPSPSCSRTGSVSLRPSSRSNRPSASLGHTPDSAMAGPHPPLDEAQPSTTVSAAAVPHAAGPSGLPTATHFYTPAVHNPFPFQWPTAPVADTSARPLLLAAQAQAYQQFYPPGYNPTHFQWLAAPVSYSPTNFPFQATAGHLSVRLPPTFPALSYKLNHHILPSQQLRCPFRPTQSPWNHHQYPKVSAHRSSQVQI